MRVDDSDDREPGRPIVHTIRCRSGELVNGKWKWRWDSGELDAVELVASRRRQQRRERRARRQQ